MTVEAALEGAEPGRARLALLWGTAVVVAVGAHAGAVVWALQAPPPAPLEAAAAAPAVMIDLAPATVAPAEEERIAPDLADAPDIESSVTDLAPAPPPPPPLDLPPPDATTPLEPPPEMADLEPPPTPVEPLPETQPTIEPPVELPPSEVAEPRPIERPQNHRVARAPEPEPEPERKEPPKPPAASQAAARAQTQAPAAQQNAAPARATAGSSGVSPARWQSRLIAHLERLKKYPNGARKRREEGTVYVRFSINDGGQVTSVQLARSSGHAELDEAVLALVRRASPVPAPPEGAPREITAPVRFSLR